MNAPRRGRWTGRARKKGHLSQEEVRRLLLEVLDGLADDLGLPKQAAPSEDADRKTKEDDRIN